MDKQALLKLLESSKDKETLLKELAKINPVGSYTDLASLGLDKNTFRPNNYPALTDPGYNEWYKAAINNIVGKHVNDTNREVLNAAIEQVPADRVDSTLKSVIGVDPNSVDVGIEDLDKAGLNGYTDTNLSPMKRANYIGLNKSDPSQDATFIHELKHVHDKQYPHVQIPPVGNAISQKDVEQVNVPTDQAVQALQNNDFNSLYDMYSGGHFSHGSIPEDAAKMVQYSKLKSFAPTTPTDNTIPPGYAEGGEIAAPDIISNEQMEQISPSNVQVPPQHNSAAMPVDQHPDFLTDEQMNAMSEQPEDHSNQIKAGLEGVAEGVAGPVAPFVEKHLMHVKPSEMRARAEEYPGTKGIGQAVGLGASLMSGVGEGAIAAKLGAGASEAAGLGKATGILGKMGAEAIDQATQMALIQGSDEISKMIINDPNTSAQSAIGNIGLSSALGGVIGAGIGSISPLIKASGIGPKATKFFGEMKDELKFIHENPDAISTATKELENLHNNTQTLRESLYGNGIKGDLIKEHLPEITQDNLQHFHNQVTDVRDMLSKAAESAKESIDTKAAAPYLEQRLKDFEGKVIKANTSEDAYNAFNDLKADLWKDAKQGKAFVADKEASALGEISSKIASKIKPMLENEEVWGKAGKVQKDFNEAFSSFEKTNANKDFIKTFTSKVGEERVLDPAKVNTFINQVGSPKAEIKSEILQNYIREHGMFADKINKTMADLGKEPLVNDQSLNTISKLMGEQTAGAKFAQKLVNKIGDNVAGKAAGGATGAAIGSIFGHPTLGAIAGEHMLGNTFGSVLSGLTKSIMEKEANGLGAKSAIDYAMNAAKGAQIIAKATANVVKPGAQVLATHLIPSDKDRAKLDKTIDFYQKNPEKLMSVDNGKIGHYLGDHQAALTETTTKAAAYLAQLKPRPYQSSPLDREIQPTAAQVQRYHRALDIAQQPAVVMEHIKNGTLQASDIQDLNHLYPSLYKQMSQQLSNSMINSKDKGHLIPYKTKVSMSLFLGQPLDTSMTPQSIMAAQPQMQQQQQPQQQQKAQGSTKRGTSTLGKHIDSYMTPLQSSEADKSSRR